MCLLKWALHDCVSIFTQHFDWGRRRVTPGRFIQYWVSEHFRWGLHQPLEYLTWKPKLSQWSHVWRFLLEDTKGTRQTQIDFIQNDKRRWLYLWFQIVVLFKTLRADCWYLKVRSWIKKDGLSQGSSKTVGMEWSHTVSLHVGSFIRF